MDSLQHLAATKFVLKFLESHQVTLSKTVSHSKLLFFPPKSSEMLHAADPLFVFAAVDDAIEQIVFELTSWANNNVSHMVFEDEVSLELGEFRWRNAQIDARATAANLATCLSLIIDDRLILAVTYGWFEIGKQICETNSATLFRYENAVAMYRRLALGFISPSDVMSTMTARLRFPMGFLLKVPLENFSSLNFIDATNRLIYEYVFDPSDEAFKLMTSFFANSKRNVSETLPPLISRLIPTPALINDRRRCQTIIALAEAVCGEEPIRLVVEKWPGTTGQGFSDMEGLYLASVRHPTLANNLVRRLAENDFRINWSTMVSLCRHNDFAAKLVLNAMAPEKLWWALSEHNFELFFYLCDTNARKSITFLRDALSKEKFETLVKARNYSCLLAACKRGHFLVVKVLTEGLEEADFDQLFSFQSYEAFFLATQGGYIAIVEWLGMLCTKYSLKLKYEEAHLITLRMLEIEAKMLETALDTMKEHNIQ